MVRRGIRRTAAKTAAPAGGSRFHRGAEGRKLAEQVKEMQEKQRASGGGGRVFRFFVPVGETKEMVVLDDEPDFFMWEHNYKGADNRYGHIAACCKEWETCPACETTDSNSYYGMFLTCIDLSGYTDKQGNEVEFSRKLVCVKPSQQKKFLRHMEKHGTLRGAIFEMTRDGDKDSAIGNDIEFIEFMDEEELTSYIREWTDKDGKVHTEDCSVAYVYEEIFEEPTPENICAQLGIPYSPNPGSSRANREALKNDEEMEDEEEEEAPVRSRRAARAGRAVPARAAKGRGTRRRAVDEEEKEEDDNEPPWDEEEEAEEPAEEKPTRSRRKAPAAPSRRRPARK